MPTSEEVAQLTTKVHKAEAHRNVLVEKRDQLSQAVVKAQTHQSNVEAAQALIQVTAQETQEQLKLHVQDLVQHALESIFPGKYQFHLNIDLKNGRTAADLFLTDTTGRRVDPVFGNGGGLVEVVAFALRIVGWSLARTHNTILMDEPFSAVSAGLRPAVINLLKDISSKLKLQFIMVTHDEDMMATADRIFTITQKNGRSRITVHEGTAA